MRKAPHRAHPVGAMNRKRSVVTNGNSKPTEGRFLTVADVAARWGCTRTLVYDEIRAGRLRALTIGTHAKRVSHTELARYERDRTGVAS